MNQNNDTIISEEEYQIFDTIIKDEKDEVIIKPGKIGLSKVFINLIRDLVHYIEKKDYDLFILILGAEGSGKSTLALRLASFINYVLYGKLEFSLKYIYYDELDIIKFFHNIVKQLTVHIFDEAHNILSSQDVGTTFSRKLTNYFKTARAFKQVYIFNSINIDLNTDLLRRTDVIIVIDDRGYAKVYFGLNKDKLVLELLDLKKKYGKSFNISVATQFTTAKPNFIMRFTEIEEEEFSKYYDYKFKRLMKHKELIKQSILNKLKKEELISLTSLSKEYKLTNTDVFNIVKALQKQGALIKQGNGFYVRRDVVEQALKELNLQEKEEE